VTSGTHLEKRVPGGLKHHVAVFTKGRWSGTREGCQQVHRRQQQPLGRRCLCDEFRVRGSGFGIRGL